MEETQTGKRANKNDLWLPYAYIFTNSILFIYLFLIGHKLISPNPFDYSSGQATFASPISLQILIPLILLFGIVLFLIGIKYRIHIIIKLLPFFIFAAACSNRYITNYLGLDIWQEHKLLGVILIAGSFAIPLFVIVHFFLKIMMRWHDQKVIKKRIWSPLVFVFTNIILFLHLFFLGQDQLAANIKFGDGEAQFIIDILIGICILLIPLYGIILFVIGIWYGIHLLIKLLPFLIFAVAINSYEIARFMDANIWQERKILGIILLAGCAVTLVFTVIQFLPRKWQE